MGIIEGGKIIEGAVQRARSRTLGSPALGTTNAVHAALAAATGGPQTITTGITNPDVPRNITATTAGTAGDVKAVAVTVNGTNVRGEPISEVLPAFTVDTNGTVAGSKAFATVTSYTVPAMDGTGCTVAIGVGAKLGLPDALARDQVTNAHLNGVREGTRPTVAVSGTAVESNTVQLNSALNGNPVAIDY